MVGAPGHCALSVRPAETAAAEQAKGGTSKGARSQANSRRSNTASQANLESRNAAACAAAAATRELRLGEVLSHDGVNCVLIFFNFSLIKCGMT